MITNNKKAELLSPASTFESVRAAFNAGADAVYIGGQKFGARAYADNMNNDELLSAIDYAHLMNKKLYMTVNTLLKNQEIENQLYDYLLPYYERGLDAVIVQDMGVFNFIRQYFPFLPIHASTQMAITGEYTPVRFEKMNIERIVTARELSLKEIKNIHDKAPNIEIESFVHGALCMGYSGMCFFSSSLGERSGNRGRCAQSCRLNYNLCDKNGKKDNSMKDKDYCLSPKDLCTIDFLPQIIEAGVYSLKIEGRMKRAEYTAGVTEIYRKYLDMYLNDNNADYKVSDEDRIKLMDLYNRGGFTKGYYNKRNGADMMSSERPNHYGVFAGNASYTKKGLVFCSEIDLNKADVMELRVNNKEDSKKINKNNNSNFYKADSDKRTNVCYNEFVIKEAVKKGQKILIPYKGKNAAQFDNVPVFRMKNDALLTDLEERFINNDKKVLINAKLKVAVDEPLSLTVYSEWFEINVSGPVIEQAKNSSTDRAQLLKSLNKTGQTCFKFENIDIRLSGECFVPVKVLNELRREALNRLEQQILNSYRRDAALQNLPEVLKEHSDENKTLPDISVSVSTKAQAYELVNIEKVSTCYIDLNAFNFWTGEFDWEKKQYLEIVRSLTDAGKEVCISLPVILRMDGAKLISDNADWIFDNVSGVLAHNVEELYFIKNLNDKNNTNLSVIADYSLYQMNGYAVEFLKEEGICRGTYPMELTKAEIAKLGRKISVPMELIYYGYMPMMFTSQCQKKNSGRCNRSSSDIYLKDRKGKVMLVRSNCEYCYNTIYNSESFSLFGLESDVKGLAVGAIRFNFTREDAGLMKKIIYNFIDRFYEGRESEIVVSGFTRGHFRKGVE